MTPKFAIFSSLLQARSAMSTNVTFVASYTYKLRTRMSLFCRVYNTSLYTSLICTYDVHSQLLQSYFLYSFSVDGRVRSARCISTVHVYFVRSEGVSTSSAHYVYICVYLPLWLTDYDVLRIGGLNTPKRLLLNTSIALHLHIPNTIW